MDPESIRKALASDPAIRAVYTQASETSTGTRHPVREIAEITKRYEDKVVVVDAITGIGVFDIPMDQWGIDVLVSGSQKALMLPPGLALGSERKGMEVGREVGSSQILF